MSKRIDWDQVSRKQRAQQRGSESAFDELPPVDSWADQRRVEAGKKPTEQSKASNQNTNTTTAKKRKQKVLAKCPLCGTFVGKMKRHLRRAHGAIAGHEHETPNASLSETAITPCNTIEETTVISEVRPTGASPVETDTTLRDKIMPEITRFYGIIIKLFFGDHPPPHFHAVYGEHNALFSIETLEMIEGDLPSRAKKLVLEWASEYQDELARMWESQEFKKLPPLQ